MFLKMIRWGRLVRYSRAQRRPRVSKLRAKGLSGCHPSWQQPRQLDGGPEGQIKNYSHDKLLKETELKAALTGSTRMAKGSPPKKAYRLKKERRLLFAPNLQILRGVVTMVMRLLMNENQECQSEVHVTA
jgi:hypothetical protein